MNSYASKTGFAMLVWMLALLLAAIPALAEEPLQTDTGPRGNEFVAGELIVTYEEAPIVTSEDVHEDAVEVEGTFEQSFPEIDAAVVEIPTARNDSGNDVEQVLAAKEDLEDQPDVAAVDLNYIHTADFEPDDPKYRTERIQQELNAAKFPAAWNITKGKNAVEVGVVDSGCDKAHPDLGRKIAAQRDFVQDDRVANDLNGHGTHVAGSVAGKTNNGVGMAAGGFYTRVNCARVLGQDGSGSTTDIMDGIEWSVDRGSSVVNLSLGGAPYQRAFADLIRSYYERGIMIAAAAGNSANNAGYRAGTPHYPSSYYGALGVASTTYQDQRSGFSEIGSHVDVAAPGSDVLSTLSNGDAPGGGGYGYKSGTSMATPQASALGALLHTRGCDTAEKKYARIRATADDLGPAGRDDYFGIGRIDAYEAVAQRCAT